MKTLSSLLRTIAAFLHVMAVVVTRIHAFGFLLEPAAVVGPRRGNGPEITMGIKVRIQSFLVMGPWK